MADELTRAAIDAALEDLNSEMQQFVVVPMPDLASVTDVGAWSRAEARDLAEAGAIRNDEQTLEAVDVLLRVFAEAPLPPDFVWRFVIGPGLDMPLLPVLIGFAAAQGDAEAVLAEMTGVNVPSPLGQHVADFEINGRRGVHCLRFASRDERGKEDAEFGDLWVTAAAACRRQLAPVGLTDVLAVADTSDVYPLLASLPTLYELVTGDYLADAVRSAVPAP